jgi:FAD/FMN-containing dehydrogenase
MVANLLIAEDTVREAGPAGYDAKKAQLVKRIKSATGEVRLGKAMSHLFRERTRPAALKLDVHAFDHVLDVNPTRRIIDTEGMTSYERLVEATLAQGLLPAVVPQLKAITIGGAVAGLGIEASSFRYGLAHETVEEMEVLLANGDVVTCTPENEHRDLFFGLPNSFGTLGYTLRLKARAVPTKPFVHLKHLRIGDAGDYFQEVERSCASDIDFIDGVVFGPGEHYLTLGRFVDRAPYTSDYTYMNIFYRSIRERAEDYLTARDFIWRWDTDWFWCARVMGVQNPLVRLALGRKYLNSKFYKNVADLNNRIALRQRFRRLIGIHQETVIQDVDVPIANAPEFLGFFQREVGITPVWICPFRSFDPARRYPLFPTDPNTLYVNFGFWDVVPTRTKFEEGHFNRLIERKIMELGGIKSLYSDSYFTEDEFWRLYNRDAYDQLKRKYDPDRRLADIYRKCVRRE